MYHSTSEILRFHPIPPYHFSFTVPLKPLSVLEYRDMYVDETLSKPPCIHLKIRCVEFRRTQRCAQLNCKASVFR